MEVARHIYTGPPDTTELAALGMAPEDVAEGEVDLWPENAQAVATFIQMGTQWRHGMGGITGLDYGALEAVLRIRQVPSEDWQDVLDGVRTMERAVLEMRAEKNG